MRSASAPDSYTHNTSRVNNPPAGLANADTESAHKTYNHAPPPTSADTLQPALSLDPPIGFEFPWETPHTINP